MASFSLTAKQVEANDTLGSARHVMLFGGSRSGKTFLIVRAIVVRALKAPGSRHAVLRFRFNAVKASVVYDTFPKVMELCFPGVKYDLNKTDWFASLSNGSEIWFGGLDDKERTEKILGQEYCVDPAAKILMADLSWRAAKDVMIGEQIIGFPEDLSGHCKLLPSTVEAAKIIRARKFRIVTDKGETIVSEDHRFVAHYDDRRHRNFRQFSWRAANQLKIGDVLRWTCEPWEYGASREDGWFSGMLDGEGWVSAPARMAGVAQCEGVCLDQLRAWMTKNRIAYADRIGTGKAGKRGPCHKLTANGLWASLRMLGIAQPKRLDGKALWSGTRAFRNGNGIHQATVLDIQDLGEGDVCAIQTSTKTLIADGFFGHNCTIFLNECSQIPWNSRGVAVTRLAQKSMVRVDGLPESVLPLRMWYDENPPDKGHWSYRLFVQKVDPETREPVSNPTDYASCQLNPRDNQENLPEGYLDTLRGLSGRLQKRFLEGQFRDANPNALFPESELDRWRVIDRALPDMQRIVIAVDPSGSGDTDNADNDAIGIVVAGLGTDGNGYLLEDLTVKAGPATWGRIAASAYDRHRADLIVAETNFGGAMVKQVIQTARPRTPYKELHASRGKVVRAEPISSLVELGKVRLVGYFPEMEDELSGFTTGGYVGDGSPNRADAFVWAFSELFPGLTKEREEQKFNADDWRPTAGAMM